MSTMKAIWVCVLAVLFPAVTSVEYAKYEVSKYLDHDHHEGSAKLETYRRRCGVIPNVFQCERAQRSDTEFGEYPWQVAILNGYDKDSFVCSGALVSSTDVLTSATCVKSLAESYIRVRLGEWDIATDRNPKEAYANLELGVVKKTIHPHYSPGADYSPAAYDVALLKLEYAVDFSSYPQISPLCLPSHEIDLEYAECFVAGWSESELNKIKVSQFQSEFWKIDQLGQKSKEHYDIHGYAAPYHNAPKYTSPDYETKVYKPFTLLSSVIYNLTSVPLVTDIKSRTLDDAQVVVLEKYDCKETLGVHLQPDQTCVAGINGYDVCKADLGSAVACIVPDPEYSSKRYRRDAYSAVKRGFTAGPGSRSDSSKVRLVAVGVMSHVYPCNLHKENPAVATDVIKSLDFILKNIDYTNGYDY